MPCEDCNRPYGTEHGFPDLIIPFWAWATISTSKDDGGLLCPSCICKRLHDAGISCAGAFASGPIKSVSELAMTTMRRLENIELAITGRANAWEGVVDLISEEEMMRLRSELSSAYRKINDLENDLDAARAA